MPWLKSDKSSTITGTSHAVGQPAQAVFHHRITLQPAVRRLSTQHYKSMLMQELDGCVQCSPYCMEQMHCKHSKAAYGCPSAGQILAGFHLKDGATGFENIRSYQTFVLNRILGGTKGYWSSA